MIAKKIVLLLALSISSSTLCWVDSDEIQEKFKNLAEQNYQVFPTDNDTLFDETTMRFAITMENETVELCNGISHIYNPKKTGTGELKKNIFHKISLDLSHMGVTYHVPKTINFDGEHNAIMNDLNQANPDFNTDYWRHLAAAWLVCIAADKKYSK